MQNAKKINKNLFLNLYISLFKEIKIKKLIVIITKNKSGINGPEINASGIKQIKILEKKINLL
jgi:hypothetical protein|tara:strand:- start:291 stop:479 length:189 start_codon:yes stop_codon:yes gene_type:complete